jgi:hypothetical protein
LPETFFLVEAGLVKLGLVVMVVMEDSMVDRSIPLLERAVEVKEAVMVVATDECRYTMRQQNDN